MDLARSLRTPADSRHTAVSVFFSRWLNEESCAMYITVQTRLQGRTKFPCPQPLCLFTWCTRTKPSRPQSLRTSIVRPPGGNFRLSSSKNRPQFHTFHLIPPRLYLLRNKNVLRSGSTTYIERKILKNAFPPTMFLPASARRSRVGELQPSKKIPVNISDVNPCNNQVQPFFQSGQLALDVGTLRGDGCLGSVILFLPRLRSSQPAPIPKCLQMNTRARPKTAPLTSAGDFETFCNLIFERATRSLLLKIA
jgi:hypothetical protein